MVELVQYPIKATLMKLPLIALLSSIALNAAGQTISEPIRWETSFKKAQVKAEKAHKPLFYLQLFGKLNDSLC